MRLLRYLVVLTFFSSSFSPYLVQAQEFALPAPGQLARISPSFNPPVLAGIKVHTDNPFKFDFILDKGDSNASNARLVGESNRLIKYFLTALTVPEQDLWVNLSPYEKDRIIPQNFGKTQMGEDLLGEDYVLKQITSSLIYPDSPTGKEFWKRVYAEAEQKFGTTNIPVNTFNKVWILPEKAVIYENAAAGTAYVVESKLKVMLEQDYLSLDKHAPVTAAEQAKVSSALGSQIVREVVLPELNKEVNESADFARLRQVYSSLVLAAWYKKKVKDSVLSEVYADRYKIAGVNANDSHEKEKIYQRYIQAFKKGAFNFIREQRDPMTEQMIPRKYFSGGANFAMIGSISQKITDLRNLLKSIVGKKFGLVPTTIGVTGGSGLSRRDFLMAGGAAGTLALLGNRANAQTTTPLFEGLKKVYEDLRVALGNIPLREGRDVVLELLTLASQSGVRTVSSDRLLNLFQEARTQLETQLQIAGIQPGTEPTVYRNSLNETAAGLVPIIIANRMSVNGTIGAYLRFYDEVVTKSDNYNGPFIATHNDVIVGLLSAGVPQIAQKKYQQAAAFTPGVKVYYLDNSLYHLGIAPIVSYLIAHPTKDVQSIYENALNFFRVKGNALFEPPLLPEQTTSNPPQAYLPEQWAALATQAKLLNPKLTNRMFLNQWRELQRFENQQFPFEFSSFGRLAYWIMAANAPTQGATELPTTPPTYKIFPETVSIANVKNIVTELGTIAASMDIKNVPYTLISAVVLSFGPGNADSEQARSQIILNVLRQYQETVQKSNPTIAEQLQLGYILNGVLSEGELPWFVNFVLPKTTDQAMRTEINGRQLKYAQEQNSRVSNTEVSRIGVDNAMKGGIDFNTDRLNLELQNAGGEIKFRTNPAMLRQLENAPGLMPLTITVKPMTDLVGFLGLHR